MGFKAINVYGFLTFYTDQIRCDTYLINYKIMNKMKIFKILSLLLIAFTVQKVSGQSCDIFYDYSTQGSWNYVNMGNPSNPRITVTGGSLFFNNAPDGQVEIRATNRLGRTLCDSWVAEFDFTPTGTGSGSAYYTGHMIFNLTAGDDQFRWGANGSDQDGIGICFLNQTNQTALELTPRVMDGTTHIFDGCRLVIELGQTYRIRLERIQTTGGRLSVFDEGGNLIDECCFDIPETVEGLTHIQHSNQVTGDWRRILTATIGNTCIQDCHRIDPCCLDEEIEGDDIICLPGDVPTTYSVGLDPDATYIWSVGSAWVTWAQSPDNEIRVTDWGGVTGTVQISVDITCGCNTTTLTKDVFISDLSGEAGFNTTISTSNGLITPIDAIPVAIVGGTSHWWQIYEADDCDPSNKTLLGENTGSQVGLRSPGTGSTFNVISPDPGFTDIVTTKCYVIVHIVDDGNCTSEARAKIMSTGSKMFEVISSEMYEYNLLNRNSGDSPAMGNSPTGIPRNSSEMNDVFNVFPNPSSNNLKIVPSQPKPFSVIINGMSGKELSAINMPSGGSEMDVSGLAAGMYIVKIFVEGELKQSQKISIVK